VLGIGEARLIKVIELSKITRAKGYLTWAQLDEELLKCDVRCPNCHRMRHYGIGHYGKGESK